MGIESWFGGNKEEKNTPGARHIVNTETGELGAEDQDNVDMAANLRRLYTQLERAKRDTDAGMAPEIPVSEIQERIDIMESQMPYGSDQ